ncbi:MAG: 4-hydroxythreonine-4-phosphate dehydrogenase PdxA [Phycisphaerales bacterium]|nr:4-hydroxythreonine-4-phosphate dehydrogenase PdxA [Phycisphaerales bacterium]MCB9862143.1 4-hydroxythreonine-4-phosphate dehydrogenase PdxA [Phycisphaerales bacterium]
MADEHQLETRPTIGITMGDPHGIGAEVIVKALADHSLRERAKFVVYGLAEQIESAADFAELQPYWHVSPRGIEHGDRRANVRILDFDEHAMHRRGPAQATAEGGRASMAFLEDAMRDARFDEIDAIVTGPINKTSWKLAGYARIPGHTELLAERFRARRVTMMFVGGPLRVALASTHVALFDLRNHFTIGHVFQPIDLMHQAMIDWFGFTRPRIGVAGLNPHASENGRFGDEEARIIEPAIDMARNHGINASGPYPADTLFRRAAHGEFDGVVAMYHDQALIPVKLLAFDEAVNITLGLPIIRTSVDHGTAFDIVDRNRADPGSMKAAIRLAVELADQRRAKKLRDTNGEDSPEITTDPNAENLGA